MTRNFKNLDSCLFLQAKAMLKKALTHDGSYLPAIYQLVELLMKEENYNNAVEMYYNILYNYFHITWTPLKSSAVTLTRGHECKSHK